MGGRISLLLPSVPNNIVIPPAELQGWFPRLPSFAPNSTAIPPAELQGRIPLLHFLEHFVRRRKIEYPIRCYKKNLHFPSASSVLFFKKIVSSPSAQKALPLPLHKKKFSARGAKKRKRVGIIMEVVFENMLLI